MSLDSFFSTTRNSSLIIHFHRHVYQRSVCLFVLALSTVRAAVIICSPILALMDDFHVHQSTQNSQQHRSRSNNHLTSTAEQLSGLDIDGNNQVIDTIDATAQSTNYLRPFSPSQDFIPAPIAQQSLRTPFPLLSEEDLNPNWSYLVASEEYPSNPLLRLDPPESTLPEVQQHQSYSDRRSVRSSSNPSTMR